MPNQQMSATQASSNLALVGSKSPIFQVSKITIKPLRTTALSVCIIGVHLCSSVFVFP
ncbi:hypothetical protein [Fischerella thermalis]|uniref:hypothetical protein n=1 Tax=Fischerella thermalis TaxID=372787 RepID=UPI0015E118B4|nr:hypothetical protein [Fischerella thermalis]